MQLGDIAASEPVRLVKGRRWQDRPLLIVDSSPFMRRLIADVLRHAGADHVFTFANGTEGLDAARTYARPVVIADWSKKDSAGPELVRKLRREKLPMHTAPVIVLGDSGLAGSVERARDAGVSSYILRPFSPATLFTRLEDASHNPRPFVQVEGFAGPDRRTPRKITDRPAWKRGADVTSGLATPLEAALNQADAMAAAMMRQGDMIAARVGRSLRLYLERVRDIGPRETEIIELHRSALRRLQEAEGAPPEHRNELVNGLETITARRMAA
ncbi:MAG: PleD family two-component system response regulator [Glycocaulis sp.]